jgi:hypothetical protein
MGAGYFYVMSHFRARIGRIALFAAAHACISASVWIWALGVAMGLGFKDRAAWTFWDQFQATVVPVVAMILTTPGNYFLELNGGWLGIAGPWLLNSIVWAAVIVGAWSLFHRKRNAT